MNELVYQPEAAMTLLHDLNPRMAYPWLTKSTLNFLGSGFRQTWYKRVTKTRIANTVHTCRADVNVWNILYRVPVLIACNRL